MKLRLLKRFKRRPSLIKVPLPGFDPIYYLSAYSDVQAAGLDPLDHYLQYGWKEGRDPSAGFSTSGYLAANSDVATSGSNPLVHYVNAGLSEGRGGFAKDTRTPAPQPNVDAGPMHAIIRPDPAALMPLQGFADEISHTFIRGWALPHNSLSARARIHIIVNGVCIGHSMADEFRLDLERKEVGDARYGFAFVFSPPLDDKITQTIVIRRVGDGFEIGRSVL